MSLFFRVDDNKHGKYYFPTESEGFPHKTPGMKPKFAEFEQKSRFQQPIPSKFDIGLQSSDKKQGRKSELPFYLKEYVNMSPVMKERMLYEDLLCSSTLSYEAPINAKTRAKRNRKIWEEIEKEQYKSPRTFLSNDIYCRTPRSFHMDARTRSPHYSLKEHQKLPKILPLKLEYRDVPDKNKPIYNDSGRSMHFLRNTVVSPKDKDQLLIYSAPLSGSGSSAPQTGDLTNYNDPLAYASAARATAPNLPKSKYVKPASKSYSTLTDYMNTGETKEPLRKRAMNNPLTQRLDEAKAVEDSEVMGYVASKELPAKVVWTARTRNYKF